MNITLIAIHVKKSAPEAMPLGLAMLQAFAQSNSKIAESSNIVLLETSLDEDIDVFVEKIISTAPEILVFSIYLWNSDVFKTISNRLKLNPNIKIIIGGGPEVTAAPVEALMLYNLDYALYGEGEESFSRLLLSIIFQEPLESSVGILYREDLDNFKQLECSISNIESLVSPFLSGVINLNNYSGVLWELSRGCPFKCGFCYESRGASSVRQFSLERIEAELRLFVEHGVTQIFVLDPTFNVDLFRAKSILRLIKRIAPMIHFTFEVRAEFLDKEQARLFAEISCGLQIGLQSINKEALSFVNRSFVANIYREKIMLLNKTGAIFGLDLIYGLPYDNYHNFRLSLDFAIALQPNNIDIFQLAILHGTKLYDDIKDIDILYQNDPPYLVISSETFPETDILKARNLKLACDIFYNQGRAVGWFFIVLETLKVSPSNFFENFYFWLDKGKFKKKEITCDEIFDLQIKFIRKLFIESNLENLLLLMIDIIKYHNLYNKTLTAEQDSIKEKKSTHISLNTTAFIENFSYDIDNFLDIGRLTLKQFIKEYKRENVVAIFYFKAGVVNYFVVNSIWEPLVQRLSSRENIMLDMLKKTSNLSKSEVEEFINYLIREEIVVLS